MLVPVLVSAMSSRIDRVCRGAMVRLWPALLLLFALNAAATDFLDWNYSLRVSFTNYGDRTALTGFPVLVRFDSNLADFAYCMFASSEGCDLRFTDAGTMAELPYEIEHWTTNGDSYVWVRIPVFTNNCSIRAWFGNPDALLPDYATNGSVWSENYAAVYHLAGPRGAGAADATSNGQHWAAYNIDPEDWEDARVSRGLTLNANTTNEYLMIGPFIGFPTTQISLSYWVRTTEPGVDGVLSYATTASDNDILIFNSPNIVFYRRNFVATGVAQNDDLWHLMAYTWRASDGSLNVYRDGENAFEATLSTGTMITDGGVLVCGQDQDLVGGGFDPNQAFSGTLDEIRISNVIRPADWVWASWMNVANYDAFNTYGRVVSTPGRALLIVR